MMTRIFAAFLLVLGICQANSVLENSNDTEVDWKYRLPSGVVVPIEYKLHLTPDLVKFTFDGEVDITLKALVTNNTLTLNLKDLAIQNIKFMELYTKRIFWNEYVLDKEHEILNIVIRPLFQKDHHYSLKIKYTAILNDKSRGFFRSRVMQGSEVIGYTATTHFQSTYAREAFPCWDEPIYKAKFSISLTHNKTFQALSNTDVLTREEKGGVITTTFKKTPPMPTYLVAFVVVSDYQFKEDKVGNFTYRVWTKKSTIDQTDYALEMGRKLLEQLDLYTNIPYHRYMGNKIDQIWQKDFPAGATENWGLVIYSENALLYDEALFTVYTKMTVLKGIAHEFAHQWFGDLVSPKWWKYVWLSEGFANYFQYFITDKVVPDMRLNEMFVVDSMQGTAMAIDEIPGQRPINQDATSPQEIGRLFDSIAYSKAGCIIRMMSHAMTEEVFHEGLKHYLTNHALGNADSNDLFESLQKALNESGNKWEKPVNVIMHNWVENSGYPVLTVKRVDDGYQLTQKQFVMVLEKTNRYLTKWWIPITYVEESNPNFINTTPIDWFSPNDESHILPSKERTGWYIFNTQQTGYYRVNYDVENWKLLMKELNKGNNTKIHVVNRAQMVDDALSLARADSLNYTVALDVTLYLTHEADYMPWQPAFRQLNFLRNLLRNTEKYYTFTRYVAYLMRALTKKVGYEPKANDSDLIKMLKIDAMRWACEVGVKDCTSYAEKTYQQWLKNPELKLDINLKTEILCAGIRTANHSMWTDTLTYITASLPDVDVRGNRLPALACSNSSDILWKYLNSTLAPGYPIDFQTAASTIMSRHPAGPQLVFDFLRNEYEHIQKIANFETIVGGIAIKISGGVTSEQQYIDLIAFLLDRKLVEPLQVVVEQATKKMIWINKFKPTVDEWLGSNSNLFESPEDGNNASSVAIASFLVIFSLFITRFY